MIISRVEICKSQTLSTTGWRICRGLATGFLMHCYLCLSACWKTTKQGQDEWKQKRKEKSDYVNLNRVVSTLRRLFSLPLQCLCGPARFWIHCVRGVIESWDWAWMLPLLLSSCPPAPVLPGRGCERGFMLPMSPFKEKHSWVTHNPLRSFLPSSRNMSVFLLHFLTIQVYFLFCSKRAVQRAVLRLIWTSFCTSPETGAEKMRIERDEPM